MNRLIDAKTVELLRSDFEKEMDKEVELVMYSDLKGEYAEFANQFIGELSEITPKIKVIHNSAAEGKAKGFETDPTFTIAENLGYRLVFNGTPAGHEANTMIETIKIASKGETSLTPQETEWMGLLEKEVRIKVFTTTTCPYCPQSAVAAAKLAVANPKFVTAETIETQENPELGMKYNVSSVPQQMINDDMASVTIGVQPQSALVMQVLQYGSSHFKEIAKELEEKLKKSMKLIDHPKDVITLTEATFDQAVKKYPNLVVDCWAEWCAPCRMLTPVIDALAVDYTDRVVFAKLNVDQAPGISTLYKIETIPRLLFFQNGKLIHTQIGAHPRQEIEKVLSSQFKLIVQLA